MSNGDKIGPGDDVVSHSGTGEKWVVAYADYERGASEIDATRAQGDGGSSPGVTPRAVPDYSPRG